MPKKEIDYSNTTIYKIYCKDTTVKDIYVGHTTNFFVRKYQHKIACNDKKNTSRIYKTIRDNGGWENWDMSEIAKYKCSDSTEARIKEQQHYEELNASLNSRPPYGSFCKKYTCLTCNIHFENLKNYNEHILSEIHNKKKADITQENSSFSSVTKNEQNEPINFYCDKCDYKCSKKYNWNRHISTPKHILATKNEQNEQNEPEKIFSCVFCDKKYASRNGLWKHNKNCKPDSNIITPELIVELIKDNKELKNIILEQSKTICDMAKNNVSTNISTNNSNNTTNSHNKAFNLNVFLNETCKEAINISDFVNSIKVSFDDLENTGRKGYIDGISNIIAKNLRDLEEPFRPIHCSDSKREIIYIKDNDQWTKETDDKPILTRAIKIIANENIKQIKKWREKYPDCTDADSKKNDLYLKIVSNSMNGLTEEESQRNIKKIITNVSKETIIQKNNY